MIIFLKSSRVREIVKLFLIARWLKHEFFRRSTFWRAAPTRKEDLLYREDEMARLVTLRRWLAGGTSKAAMNGLLKLMERFETNEKLLQKFKPSGV